MLEVAEDDGGLYHNICPEEFIVLVKEAKASVWV